MVIAIARFQLRADKAVSFETAWREASGFLVRKRGYLGHRFGPQCEDRSCYVLEIEWDSIDAHSAFLLHADFRPFLQLLWPHFAADPELFHFEPLEPREPLEPVTSPHA
ncbi:antibiotic biosynthesis monooxygenase family protein [Paraburkholderia kururiensis]|uniref:antibiotic biosynthesis monooxygenase family protein n=1 Tax=Paraburkholderia kururiensis TaxID=984307 RepID=UPI000A920532|nr:antibiotic biosynthesis monooxygenase [Paraburkholderia kururiensis]